jgi:hypothetical protein
MIALAEEKATPNEFARIAWSDLYDYLRTACHQLNAEGSCDGLRIGSSDTLRLERPTREQVDVLYLLGSGKPALLKITFDFDLLYLRYTVDGDPFSHDLLAVSEGYTYGFQTRERAFKTADEIGRSMLLYLTSGTA